LVRHCLYLVIGPPNHTEFNYGRLSNPTRFSRISPALIEVTLSKHQVARGPYVTRRRASQSDYDDASTMRRRKWPKASVRYPTGFGLFARGIKLRRARTNVSWQLMKHLSAHGRHRNVHRRASVAGVWARSLRYRSNNAKRMRRKDANIVAVIIQIDCR